jgi:enamine deaminase RidA (YjgF/YER057c/UK114 family)
MNEKQNRDHVALTEKRKQQLDDLNNTCTKLCAQLGVQDIKVADISALLAAEEKTRTDLIAQAKEALKNRQTALDNAVIDSDIDIQNESWEYDFPKGMFSRKESQTIVPIPKVA